MNKFVLGIFVILAIGTADLPSTLACSPDMLHQLSMLTTTSTQSPSNLNPPAPAPAPHPTGPGGYARPWVAPVGPDVPDAFTGLQPIDPINSSQPRSIDAGSNVFELEMEGFSICDTDGTEGLTFDEINACRVRYTMLLNRLYTIISVNLIFWNFRSVWGILWFILGPQLLNLTMLMTTKMET